MNFSVCEQHSGQHPHLRVCYKHEYGKQKHLPLDSAAACKRMRLDTRQLQSKATAAE